MDELKALENIRKLLNLDSDTIPVFDLANKKNYKDTIENINILLDENEPNSIQYLWNHINVPFQYEMDLDLTEDSKGFIKSYIEKRNEWLDNSTLFNQIDSMSNILRNINAPILGNRIVLRSGNDNDIDLFYRHLKEDGDFMFYTMLPPTDTYLKRIRYNVLEPYSFVVEDMNTKEILGVVALRQLRKDLASNDGLEAAALSYYIFKEKRRNGYAKEACNLLLNAYFNEELYGLTKTEYRWEIEVKRVKGVSISLDTSINNLASINLAKSLGFIEEGHLHNTWFYDGKYSDGLFFFINKERYLSYNKKD